MSAGTSTAQGLFRRYRRWTWLTLAGALTLAAALMILEINGEYESEMQEEAENLLSHAGALASIFQATTNHVTALRQAAETRLTQRRRPPVPRSELLTRLLIDRQGDLWTLDHPPEPFDTAVIGNLTGLARAVDDDLARELEMALALNSEFRVASQALSDAAWVYYVSTAGFINLFPWHPSSKYHYAPTLLEKEFVTALEPKANPVRTTRWTAAYRDEAGLGLMITAAAPVYDGDAFRGVVCVDMTLSRLRRLVSELPAPYGSAFIINDRGQLLAHRDLVRPDDPEPNRFEIAFPEDIRDRAAALVDEAARGGTMLDAGDWRVDAEPIAGTPFTLVVLVSERIMLREVLTRTPLTMLALLAGLGAMLAVSNAATRREFIQPSERLVGFIEAESRGQATGIPPVPEAWRPWFETVHSVFNAHAQLVAIRHELDVARRMQQAILPTRFPDRPDVQLFARMEPARQVGGDFYDFFWLDEHRLGFVVADVSDKGVPAALFMAVSRTLLRAVAVDAAGPAAALSAANDLLSQDNEQAMFVTVFYGVLDLRTGRLVFANGGHNPPALLTEGGEAAFLPGGKGMALGAVEGVPYAEAEVVMPPGAALVCYTDGVTDAVDVAGDLFGEERLLGALGAPADARTLVDRLFGVVDGFSEGAAQADDITALSIRWSGPSPAAV